MSYKKEKSETELYCEIKEAFQLFDKDNDGVITKDEEMTIMRLFGINPVDKEQKETTTNPNQNNPDTNNNEEEESNAENQTVEFNEFFDNIQQRLKDAEKDDEILSEIDPISLKTIDELKHELRISKEQISEELINKIIADSNPIPTQKKFIVYKNYIKVMLNQS